jgi:EAL domain-containing protein (putative c-di-GMP-specific phosphodiesterase class I)/GGDEF domain-containing protein
METQQDLNQTQRPAGTASQGGPTRKAATVIPFPLQRRQTALRVNPISRGNHRDVATALPDIDRPLNANAALAVGRMLRRNRPDGRLCALAIVKFPEYRLLEETFGSAIARELGDLIHGRLSRDLRPANTLLQIDSDTYTLLLDDLRHPTEAAAVLKRLQGRAGGACRLGGLHFNLSTRVGVALYPENTTEPEELVRYARVALRHASASTATTLQFFDPSLLAQLRERLWMAAELQHALEAERLELHYQGQYAIASGQLVSAEALLRLRTETSELIGPERFIGIAEESGLIVPIGRWVIRAACRQLAEWRARGLALERIAVNLSPRQLLDEELIPTLCEAVSAAGIAYGDLELELTEAQVVENVPLVAQVLEEIAALGVRIAVDDFGTGYSALAYLSRLPLHTLKIDRSFIREAVDDPRAGWIVGAIVAMAKELHLEVVAEGIETEAQRRLVVAAGCDLAQGFYLGRPMPTEQLIPN